MAQLEVINSPDLSSDNEKEEDLEEESKLSRLFYLQLYSSVLNAEKENKKKEKLKKRKDKNKKRYSDTKKKIVKSLSWMDVTNLLSRSISSTENEKDIGDVESVMVDRRMSSNSSAIGQIYGGQRKPIGYANNNTSGTNIYGSQNRPNVHTGHGKPPQSPEYNQSYGHTNGQGHNSQGPEYNQSYGRKNGQGNPPQSPEYNQSYGRQNGHVKAPQSPEYNQSYGRQNGYTSGYASTPGGSVSRLPRESETLSASSGSVNGRRRNGRTGLAQVNEGESTDSRGEEEGQSLRRNDRYSSRREEPGYGRLNRGSVASRELSVRRGSVISQRTSGPRVGNTFSRVPDPQGKTSPAFSGDETDKDFQFVGGSDDKTLKYDQKNFSFRLKNRDSVVVEQSKGRCSWRQACCNSLYLGLAAITLVFIIMLLSTSPQNYRGHYISSNLPGSDISSPKFSLCLPVPYTKERSARAGLSSQLASFLLYSLSPFNPNPDILENKDLLTELTKQYKVLESRKGAGLRKVLRSAAPTCPEVIRACQLASRQILRGEDCCNMFFKKFRYQPEGLCIEGMIGRKEESSAFPLGPEIQARLTVIINTAILNSVELDHRIVPWDTVRSRAVLVSVLHQDEVTWTRDPSRDLLLWPGHTATITAYPQLLDNQGAVPNLVSCSSEPFPYPGKQAYTRAGCRNTVMQMIAEKSVNCSLMSLPSTPGTDFPTCGPLEGLALMYILREQGDLVSQDPTIRTRFEQNLQEKCPYECERKYWSSEVISADVEEKVARLFGAESKEISIIELNHSNNKFVRTLSYESGLLVLVNRLGSVTGWLALIMLVILSARKLCTTRKRIRIRRQNAAAAEVVI